MRLFLALALPEELKDRLGDLVEDFTRADAQVKWVKTENMHLTLKFLGEVEETRLGEIYEVSRLSAGGIPPFDLRIQEVGAFPSLRRPRIVWVRAHQARGLMNLHRRIETGFQSIGFPPEKKCWTPHLTIGRVKGTRNLKELCRRLEQAVFEPVTFHIDSLHVIQSVLRSEGPLYTTRKSIPLEKEG